MRNPAGAKRVLILGATGFIGSWLHRHLLDAGHEVVGASPYPHRPESLFVLDGREARVEHWDVSDESLYRIVAAYRPEAVVHLEACVDPVALRERPSYAIERNLLQTVNVLEACRTLGVARVVLASTVAVLPSIRYQPIDAAHPIITGTEGPAGGFYGASKAACEVFGLTYADVFGLDVRVVRPSAVYGLGMSRPIGLKPIVEGIVRGEEVTVPLDAPLRDYTPVEEVAAVFAAAATKDEVADRVFFAGTGRPLTDGHGLFQTVRSAFPDARVVQSWEPLDPTGIESRYRGVLDMEPVRRQLGVMPVYHDLVDGLRGYAGLYRRFLASPHASQPDAVAPGERTAGPASAG